MRSLLIILMICLMCILLPGTARTRWVKTKGPYGGMVSSIAASGTNVYVGAYNEGQYYSMPPLPPEDMFDVRFTSQRMLEVPPSELKGSLDFPISVRSGIPPYCVSWQMHNSIGARYSVEFNGTDKSFDSKILNDNGMIVIQDLSHFALKVENGKSIPTEFAIHQSYPNPFNPISTIEFDLPPSGNVQLKVYDMLGQEVASLLNNVAYTAGSYSVRFDASIISSGTYFYRMNVYSLTGTLLFQSTKKTLLVK